MSAPQAPKPVPLPKDGISAPTMFTGRRFRLWLQDDVLLYHETGSYTESCKRFALQDIQAIVLSRTKQRRTISIVLLLLAALACLSAAYAYRAGSPAASVLLALVWAPLTAGLLFNLVLGPTCTLDLHTAVQVQRLHCCQRLGTAQRLLNRLLPEIERTQGKHKGQSDSPPAAE